MPEPQKPRDLWTDEEFVAAYGEDARKSPWPLSLGKLQRPGWTGRIPTYLVWCRHCRLNQAKGFTVAHPAGYEGRLECSDCRARYDHLLPSRRLKGALLNPLGSPRLLLLLFALTMLAVALSNR